MRKIFQRLKDALTVQTPMDQLLRRSNVRARRAAISASHSDRTKSEITQVTVNTHAHSLQQSSTAAEHAQLPAHTEHIGSTHAHFLRNGGWG